MIYCVPLPPMNSIPSATFDLLFERVGSRVNLRLHHGWYSNSFASTALFKSFERTLLRITYMQWDIEQPCLMPWALAKNPSKLPLIYTVKPQSKCKAVSNWWIEKTIPLFAEYRWWKPSNCIKALEMSNLTAHFSLPAVWWYPFTNSGASNTFSNNNLSSINVHWFSSIVSRKITWRMLAKTLEITLYNRLQHAIIGLKSFIVWAFSVLEIKAKTVAFTHVSRKPKIKKYWIATMKPPPRIGHAARKNSLVNPLGPETLSFGRDNNAL